MRTLVTFILRLWVDPQADAPVLSGREGPAWEGQVECVSSAQRAHVRNLADLARFIETEAIESSRAKHPDSPHRRNEP